MVRSRLFLLVALVLVLGLFVTACQTTATAPAAVEAPAAVVEAPAAAPAGGTIKIFTSWPLQGPMLPIGGSMTEAVDLALEHYLADHGGVGPGGFNIEVSYMDDASPTTGSWDGTIESENAQK